ncbi:MAG: wax ester/triacylglycerol synthase domain-containing protein [Solirubrobacterales bacterium]
MSAQLSPLDAAFLELEEADQSAHMHIGWALIFDPPPKAERPSLERLREQVRGAWTLCPASAAASPRRRWGGSRCRGGDDPARRGAGPGIDDPCRGARFTAADRDTVADLEVMRDGIEESLAELQQLAAAPPAVA